MYEENFFKLATFSYIRLLIISQDNLFLTLTAYRFYLHFLLPAVRFPSGNEHVSPNTGPLLPPRKMKTFPPAALRSFCLYMTAIAATTATISPAVGTHDYAVTITDNCGASCTSPTLSVTTNALPTVAVTPATSSYCTPGPGVDLTASGAVTYMWTPATGLSATTVTTVTASPATTTTYTVTGTDANGCINTAMATVNSGTTPTLNVTATPDIICSGGNSQLRQAAYLH